MATGAPSPSGRAGRAISPRADPGMAPRPVDLLVEAEFLYPMTPGSPVIRGGEVAIEGGRIVHAGAALPAGSWQAKRVLRGAGRAVLPGLVNCHCHAASTVFRSQTDDQGGGVGLYTIAFR